MKNIQCHSSTPKSEVIAFINAHAGQKIKLHYESNMYPYWGDDHIVEILLDEAGLKDALNTVAKYYIHGVSEV